MGASWQHLHSIFEWRKSRKDLWWSPLANRATDVLSTYLDRILFAVTSWYSTLQRTATHT
jgi:hypothetical protein